MIYVVNKKIADPDTPDTRENSSSELYQQKYVRVRETKLIELSSLLHDTALYHLALFYSENETMEPTLP